MLRIDRKNFSLNSCEAALTKLAQGETDLKLAHGLSSDAVGSTAALLQVIATWGRSPSAKLKVYADSAADPHLRTFAESEIGLAAFNMARSIASQSDEKISRRDALALTENFVRRMYEGNLRELRVRSAISILCIDNAQFLGRPARLYDLGADKVRSSRDFADLVEACLLALTMSQPRLRNIEPEITSAATILQEAFQNTHDHAMVDFRGNQLPRSTRGILVGWRHISRDKLDSATEGHAPLGRYFTDWRNSHPKAKSGQFLELSVFDGGPGLAQSWLSKHSGLEQEVRTVPIPIETELGAVYACLKQGGTTKTNRSAGNGLYRILRLAGSCGGFVKIRTGRLSLGRAFSQALPPALDDVEMEDFQIGSVPNEPRAWAEGTVLTIMLPLNTRPGP